MRKFELAQLNIAHLVAPLESADLSDFVANLDRINSLADQAPGFVWRLQTEDGDATAIRDFGAEFIVNMSVWQTLESLHNFVYRSGHVEIMKRRKEWFHRMGSAYSVLWWVRAGHRPDLAEAQQNLELLRKAGPTPSAFTFKTPFPPPKETSAPSTRAFDDPCPAA